MKREFLQLAQKYDAKKHFISNWYLSEKLDGIRCFWDGGITRNMPASEVPWANVEKDSRLKNESIATGLYSRYGKVIHAPDWWIDHLPLCPLDGELFCGNNSWQKLSSIVKRFDKNPLWDQVQFMILDSPPLSIVFEDGEINNTNFKKNFKNIIQWIKDKKVFDDYFVKPWPFTFIYERLIQANLENQFVKVHKQIAIPLRDTNDFIEKTLNEIVSKGGEGVIIRNPMSRYVCERSWNVLKHKPFNDDEGIVIGYNWGKETELGSKLLGLMGSLILYYKGNIFELSGFTDEERKMTFIHDNSDASLVGKNLSGERVGAMIHNPRFPLKSKVTFRYRELSDRGIPKEAKYLRPFII